MAQKQKEKEVNISLVLSVYMPQFYRLLCILSPQVRYTPHIQSGAQLVRTGGAHGGQAAEQQ